MFSLRCLLSSCLTFLESLKVLNLSWKNVNPSKCPIPLYKCTNPGCSSISFGSLLNLFCTTDFAFSQECCFNCLSDIAYGPFSLRSNKCSCFPLSFKYTTCICFHNQQLNKYTFQKLIELRLKKDYVHHNMQLFIFLPQTYFSIP